MEAVNEKLKTLEDTKSNVLNSTMSFMDSVHEDNHRVTLVVCHVWASTSMPIDELRDTCAARFGGLNSKKMKNAAFCIRVRSGEIAPVVTFYAPKKDPRLRVHMTGVKNWEQISTITDLIGKSVVDAGHTFSVEQPQIDLANLKYKLENLRIRAVPTFIRSTCRDWITSLEELKSGKPINISNDRATVLMWASGSVLVMLKRLRSGEDIPSRHKQATDLLARISRVCV